MTVCIGAIYGDNAILGASDRMLTAGGSIEFEPDQSKIFPLTSSIIAMVADDILIHAELYQYVLGVVNDRISKEPDNWLRVSDIADLYSDFYSQLRQKHALKEVLEPLGLDFDSFIRRQKEMSPEFIKIVEDKLVAYRIGGAATILAGIDPSGPHIYVVENSKISCFDTIGFAVIGSGSSHAAPHFMFSGHTRRNSGQRTLLTVHQAKRKSEAAPGVGKGTDMYLIGPQLGSFKMIEKHWLQQMDKIYDDSIKATDKVNKRSEKAVEKFVKEQAEKRTLEQKPINVPSVPAVKGQ